MHSCKAELQALQYLDDGDRTLQCLVKFPAIREVFRKYNVALPSSAAVERLFSVAGVIGTAKRNRLRPQLFEKLLLGSSAPWGIAYVLNRSTPWAVNPVGVDSCCKRRQPFGASTPLVMHCLLTSSTAWAL